MKPSRTNRPQVIRHEIGKDRAWSTDAVGALATALNAAVGDWLRQMLRTEDAVSQRVAQVLDDAFEELVLLVLGLKRASWSGQKYEFDTTNGKYCAARERLQSLANRKVDEYIAPRLARLEADVTHLPGMTAAELQREYNEAFRRTAKSALYKHAEVAANTFVTEHADRFFAALAQAETPNDLLALVAPDVHAELALLKEE